MLSGCDDQRPVAPGHLGWGSGRLVGHHAWDARWPGAPVVWSATMPGMRVPALLDGQTGARAAYYRRHLMDVIIAPGMALIVDDAMSILVWTKAFMHRRPV